MWKPYDELVQIRGMYLINNTAYHLITSNRSRLVTTRAAKSASLPQMMLHLNVMIASKECIATNNHNVLVSIAPRRSLDMK